MEKDLFQETISAVSHPFYAIDASCYKILIANGASITLYRNDTGSDGNIVPGAHPDRLFDLSEI
jgi:hypothetical protein